MQCERLKAENDKIKASNKILERHIAMQEKATREWANTLKQVTFIHAKKKSHNKHIFTDHIITLCQIHAYARAKEIETEYLKAKNDAGACITELEGRKLQAEKGNVVNMCT